MIRCKLAVACIATAVMAISLLADTACRAASPDRSQTVYSGGLQNGWQSWSWAKVTLTNAKPVHADTTSIGVWDPKGWEALYLHHDPMSTAGYVSMSFWVYGGGKGGQSIKVIGLINTKAAKTVYPAGLKKGVWTHLTVSLKSLGVSNSNAFTGVWIQNATPNPMPMVYIDDIVLVKG